MDTKKSFQDIRDSRLLYEKPVPLFGDILICIIVCFLVGTAAWSGVAQKAYIVRGNGVIQSQNKNYIMSSYGGSITQIEVSEGSYINQGDLIARIKSTELLLQQEQLRGQRAVLEQQIAQYRILLRAIQDNTNYFSETNPDDLTYYYQFENYLSQVKQNQFDASAYTAYGYTKNQIEQAAIQNQAKIDQLYYNTLQAISEKIASLQNDLSNNQIQLDALSNGENDYAIYAPASGIVHMDTEYKVGMVVSAGSAIGSIANENDVYEIVAYISLSDRPLIHYGDSCRIAITGLNQSSYGTLTGTVTAIESDVTTISESNGSNSYFKIHVKPDITYLVSKSGDKVSLSNGMRVETRVTYDEVTYFYYILESIGILVR